MFEKRFKCTHYKQGESQESCRKEERGNDTDICHTGCPRSEVLRISPSDETFLRERMTWHSVDYGGADGMLGTQTMSTLLDLAAGWMAGPSAEMREKWRGTVWGVGRIWYWGREDKFSFECSS